VMAIGHPLRGPLTRRTLLLEETTVGVLLRYGPCRIHPLSEPFLRVCRCVSQVVSMDLSLRASEAISQSFGDCHVANAPRNDTLGAVIAMPWHNRRSSRLLTHLKWSWLHNAV